MFVENTAPFFSDFGVSVVLDGVSVRGIFDNEYAGSTGGVGMAMTNPALTLPTSSVPADPVGKTVVKGAESFLIAAHEPDGTGMSILLLERAS